MSTSDIDALLPLLQRQQVMIKEIRERLEEQLGANKRVLNGSDDYLAKFSSTNKTVREKTWNEQSVKASNKSGNFAIYLFNNDDAPVLVYIDEIIQQQPKIRTKDILHNLSLMYPLLRIESLHSVQFHPVHITNDAFAPNQFISTDVFPLYARYYVHNTHTNTYELGTSAAALHALTR